jgi:GWxTD domain-containing protein
MEQKIMKIMKIILLLSLLFVFIGDIIIAQRQQKIPKKNIDKFSISAVTKSEDAIDSLQVSIYMQIPNTTLQFVKLDTNYIARFEAVIALQTNKGKQIGREVWQDSIIVNDYNSTNSILENRMLTVSYKIPAGKYKMVGSLLDLDTKNSGKHIIKLNLTDYENNQYLHEPILLIKDYGNWGFGNNLIPSVHNSTFDTDDGLCFHLSGKVLPGKYTLKTQFINKEEKVLFENIINDTTQTGIFKHIVNLPAEDIEGIGINIKTELIQGKYSSEKTKEIIIRKIGISHLISNLEEALEQMRYILDSEERKAIKKVSTKNREELFKKLWKLRDPTPDTAVNELMNEYFKRVAYTNMQFESFIDGWETDRGMIYIIFGPPDEIDKFMLQQRQEPYETWQYYRIQESFIFVGDNFGHYRLTTPFLGYHR